eukprot:5932185-Amphidinium_carterae.2
MTGTRLAGHVSARSEVHFGKGVGQLFRFDWSFVMASQLDTMGGSGRHIIADVEKCIQLGNEVPGNGKGQTLSVPLLIGCKSIPEVDEKVYETLSNESLRPDFERWKNVQKLL